MDIFATESNLMSMISSQQQITIEELFKDYDGEIFLAQPFLFEQVGEEKW